MQTDLFMQSEVYNKLLNQQTCGQHPQQSPNVLNMHEFLFSSPWTI